MHPIFIGYLAKRIAKRADFPSPGGDVGFPCAPPVEEICSVSGCIARRTEQWWDLARHTDFGVYDTPELAWSMVPAGERQAFALHAYRLYPVRYAAGQPVSLDLLDGLEPDAEPLPEWFVRLGWDAVEMSDHGSFGCSPLSCNGQAGVEGVPVVNPYCLVSSEADGFELARAFSISTPEPGPYCVVEVFRVTSEWKSESPDVVSHGVATTMPPEAATRVPLELVVAKVGPLPSAGASHRRLRAGGLQA